MRENKLSRENITIITILTEINNTGYLRNEKILLLKKERC